MQVWSSGPWQSRLTPSVTVSGYTQVSRAVAEMIAEILPVEAVTRRVIIEAIQSMDYVAPAANVLVTRSSPEVLGLAAEFMGRYAVASRVTLEAITSFALAHRGFSVPNLAVDAVSVAMAVDLDLTDAGYLGLIDASSFGYSLEWTTADPVNITERWRTANDVFISTFPAPTGRLIRSFVLPIGAGELELTELGTARPADQPNLGQLREIMVWNRGLPGEERAYVEGYLRCKWIPESCTSPPLLPSVQDVITDGLIASDPHGNPALNPGWGDLLDDLRTDPEWMWFVDCAEAEMTDDDEFPFMIPNPDPNACTVGPCYSILSTPSIRGNTPASTCQNYFNFLLAGGNINPDYCSSSDTTPGGGRCYAWFPPTCGVNVVGSGDYYVVSPDPTHVAADMETFLNYALSKDIPCLMFDDVAQLIIDSPGYLGEVPDGMEPSVP